MQYSKILLFAIVFTGLFASCGERTTATEAVVYQEEIKLGEIHFPVTGATAGSSIKIAKLLDNSGLAILMEDPKLSNKKSPDCIPAI